MRAAETARLHDPSSSRGQADLARHRAPAARARARSAEDDAGGPSVGVFLLAPALGLCFWVALALVLF